MIAPEGRNKGNCGKTLARAGPPPDSRISKKATGYINGAGQTSKWPQPSKVRVRASGVLGHGDQRLAGWYDLLEFGG
jgi:hypothetical protein